MVSTVEGQRYHSIKQKKNLCGPTCLQMILFRWGVWMDQEALAARIGLRIDEDDRQLYMLPLETAPKDNLSMLGIKLTEFNDSKAKEALEDHSMMPQVHLIRDIDNPHQFLIDNLDADHDIMANFWWGPINGKQNGHYVLVCSYDPETKEVTICDPSTEEKNYQKYDLQKLVDAMHPRWNGEERGFLVVKPKR
ncbi:C39 family peptidase [Nanoarchaeota archaeon]